MSDIYNTLGYVRISKEDGDKFESESIKNQKEIILNYIKDKIYINLIDFYVDDGYSGVNFQRPAFINMMENIEKGEINCIIVKDLSRFGRNYIESEKYIKEVFPKYNVRFISINDNYDSLNINDNTNRILFSFKNIINDAYSHDISVKIRTNLDIKRKKGDYVSPFSFYGYLKDKNNKNKIIVDNYASKIVKNIFKWKIEGLSNQAIADKLNNSGVLCPYEYKKSIGIKYESGFKIKDVSMWSSVTIGRILKNKIYIGILEQGKVTTPSYKVKKSILKDEKDWITIQNNHQPIITNEDFYMVNSIVKSKGKILSKKNQVYLFSGKIFCFDCKSKMIRYTAMAKGNTYIYYICSEFKINKKCKSHRIREKYLYNSIFSFIKNIFSLFFNKNNLKIIKDVSYLKKEEIKEIDYKISIKEEETKKYCNLKFKLYENFILGVVNKEDYKDFDNIYSQRLIEIQKNIFNMKNEKDNIINDKYHKYDFIDYLKKYSNINHLDRKIIMYFIEKIYIYEKDKIEIILNFNDCYNIWR